MDIKKIIYVLRSIGASGIARTLQNSISKSYKDRIYSDRSLETNPRFIGELHKATPVQGGAYFEFSHANLEIIFLSKNMIRISWEPGKPPIPYTIQNDRGTPKQIIEFNQTAPQLLSDNYRVFVGDSTGIIFKDNRDNIIHQENPPYRVGDSWHLNSILKPEEHIYGLGERAASINLRPGNYLSWNTDVGGKYSSGTDPLYIGTPIYLSLSYSGSYLVYFENSFRSSYRISNTLEASFDGGMLRYYLIFGSLNSIYSELSILLGHPCMPPKWVFGYHQSRWGYRSESEIRDIICGFEKHRFPISAIHLDIDYMDGYRVFSINKERFPDMLKFTDDLEKKGIKTVASINPAVKKDPRFRLFSEGVEKGYFCKLPNGKLSGGVSWPGWSVFPDFSSQAVRDWWSQQYQSLLSSGISGFWHDMNEPSSFVWMGGDDSA